MRKFLFSATRNLFVRIVCACMGLTISVNFASAQCPLSAYNEGGTITPDACGFQQVSIGSGTYVTVNVHNGGVYDFSHCNATNWGNDQLTGYQVGSGVLFYNDDNGPFCAGTHSSATWSSNFTGTIAVNSNLYNCQDWVGGGSGNSGVLDYRCTGPGNPTTYGNGQWILYGFNAGDANGGAGAWTNCYSGFMTVAPLSFNTTTLWSPNGSPSDPGAFLGCNINPDNHSWSAKRTGFTCGVYQIVVDNHSDLAQVIINGNTTTLPAGGPSNVTVYTGVLTTSSTVDFRVSAGVGASQAQITITPVVTGPLTAGGVGPNQTICPGGDPAIINSTSLPTGGAGTSYTNGSYTYDWVYQDNCSGTPISLGVNTPTYDPPGPLNNQRCYARVVTDACGTTATTSPAVVNMDVPPVITSINVDNVLCNGGSSGSIQVLTVSQGIPPYQYSDDNGATWQSSTNFNGLSAGPYNLAVRDTIGCSSTYSGNPVNIGEPTPITHSATKTDASCANVFDGSISVTASGGTPPYTYSLNGGPTQPGSTFNGLYAGTYLISVFDANGCVDTSSITVANTYVISVSIVSQSDISCYGGGDGTLTVQVNGGVPPYSYSLNGITYQASGTFTGLSAGNYIVIGRDSKGCTETVTVAIAQPAQLTVRIDSVINVLCHGDSTGQIFITPQGGTPGYTFLWSDGTTTEDNTGLSAGVLNVTVTDANGCVSSAGATVTEPLQLFLNVESYNNLFCFGDSSGAVRVSVAGGVPFYSYIWNTGSTSEDLENLKVGTYSVTATDANGCSVSVSQTLTEPSAITSSVVGTDVTCFGAANGSADLTVGGGTSPYFYLWSNFNTSQDLTGVGGGLYSVIITDNNGCEKKDSVLISEPTPLILSITATHITCFNANDGAIDLTVTGGTPNYTYLWSNGATTQDLSSLPGGTYVVTVTDANGCTATASAIIINPLGLTTNFILTSPRCFGDSTGSINLITSGGTPGYTFIWNNGVTIEDQSNIPAGTYTVTITDSRNCTRVDSVTLTEPSPFYVSGVIKHVTCFGYSDGEIDATAYGGTLPYSFVWSTGQTTEDLWNLPGGSDTVYAYDANGCQAISIYVINEPQPLVANIVSTNALCFGTSTGTVAVVPSGGTTPYEYLWNNFVTDSSQTAVAAGRYVVLLTDSNGCHTYDSVDITEPAEIKITGVVTNVACNGFKTGAIDITVTGGTGAYTFSWSNGATTEDIDTLIAGTYSVTVTDANGCTQTATFVVSQNVTLYTNVSVYNPTCFGANNGFISVVVTGGTIPYTYLWSTTPPMQGATATNLDEGPYTLTVTDANNCSATVSAVLFNPAPIVITTTPTPARCYNTATGLVTATVTGGVPPYVYQLNGVIQPSNVFSNLLPGNYIIAVRDANGCEGTATFTITAPIPVTVDLSAPQDVILQGMTTQLIAVASSDTDIINYFWSPLTDTAGNSLFDFSDCADPNNCSNPYVTPPFTTTFTVTAMNADSCLAYDTVTVTVVVQPSAFIPNSFTPNGDGLNDRFDFDILGATTVEVAVFNRWGEKVYFNQAQKNGTKTGEGWDGTKDGDPLPHDTYVYQMKVTYADGLDPQGLVKDRAGTITLVR